MWFLIPFVLLPILEIALFVQIGGAIGVGATILWWPRRSSGSG